MSTNLAASVRARLLNIAKAQGSDFQQVLVRFALERIIAQYCSSTQLPTPSLPGLTRQSSDVDPRKNRSRDLGLDIKNSQ